MPYWRSRSELCRHGLTDAVIAGSGRKLGVLLRFDMVLPVGAARDGNSSARRPQDPRNEIFDTFTALRPLDQSLADDEVTGTPVVPLPPVATSRCCGGCQEASDAGDFPRMGFISYHRAGVAKRQARSADDSTTDEQGSDCAACVACRRLGFTRVLSSCE